MAKYNKYASNILNEYVFGLFALVAYHPCLVHHGYKI